MRKNRKTILALTMMIVFSLSLLSGGLADNVSFKCNLANAVEYDTKGWERSSSNRALLTVLLAFDLLLNTDVSFDEFLLGESVFAVTGDTITIAIAGKNRGLIIFYTPEVQFAQYTTISQNACLELYAVLSANCDSAYLNDADDLNTELNLIGSMLDE